MQVFAIKVQLKSNSAKVPPEAYLDSKWGETAQEALEAYLKDHGIDWTPQWGEDRCAAESPLEPTVRLLARPLTRPMS